MEVGNLLVYMPQHNLPLIMAVNVHKSVFLIQIIHKSPYRGRGNNPLQHSSPLGRFALSRYGTPVEKSWLCQWYCLYLLDFVLSSVRKHIFHEYVSFWLEISQTLHQKCAPDRSISISKCKSSLTMGDTPLPPPSPRSVASLPRLLLPSNIVDNLAPPWKNPA